jgi:hypothetical protein
MSRCFTTNPSSENFGTSSARVTDKTYPTLRDSSRERERAAKRLLRKMIIRFSAVILKVIEHIRKSAYSEMYKPGMAAIWDILELPSDSMLL